MSAVYYITNRKIHDKKDFQPSQTYHNEASMYCLLQQNLLPVADIIIQRRKQHKIITS